MPPRAASAATEQTTEEIAAVLEEFLAEHPRAVVREDGKVLFDMRVARYTLSSEHGRCSLHMWSEERNLVRRVSSAVARAGVLRVATQRFGQTKPQTLEITGDEERRLPSARESTRTKYLRVLERVLERSFAGWMAEGFRTAMDLEKSFGPAYARGLLVQGAKAWAVIGVNGEESQAMIDGVLTVGILWLAACRESGGGRRLVQGLKVVVPRGRAALTASRMAWLNERIAQWELWELDEAAEEIAPRAAGDTGNLTTRLVHVPDEAAARERFEAAAAHILTLVPEGLRCDVEQRLRSGSELAFLLHGLEFARARTGYAGQSFRTEVEITLGAGAEETPLTPQNETEMKERVRKLFARRAIEGDKRDPLYRMQPERWLESVLRRELPLLEEHLDARYVYAQVPAFSAGDRGMLDLLGVSEDGRLAVIELKAEEDLQLAMQGLDYWIRVRWHHLQQADNVTGLGEFQRNGYFTQMRLAGSDPRLFLVAPALRIHPATEVILRHLSPRVEWELVALDERWRAKVKVVWRKRSGASTTRVAV